MIFIFSLNAFQLKKVQTSFYKFTVANSFLFIKGGGGKINRKGKIEKAKPQVIK